MKVAVVGAGFYGINLALFFAEQGFQVTLFESENEIMGRASFNNQARIHNGYHYARSFLTAARSRKNSALFIQRYKSATNNHFTQIYAIAKNFSHTNAKKFHTFCQTINAPIECAKPKVKKLFSSNMIEEVFTVEEPFFDSVKLKEILTDQLISAKVNLKISSLVTCISAATNDTVNLQIKGSLSTLNFDKVIVATYADTNRIIADSGLALIPLTYEWTELALLTLPPELKDLAITIMDGPFWSCTPFPPAKMHMLSHVRYTPHASWQSELTPELPFDLETLAKKSAFPKMINDAARFVPLMSEAKYEKSLWEIKTILPRSETNDSRPILFKMNYGMKNLSFVIGAKIDNFFELLSEISNSPKVPHETNG